METMKHSQKFLRRNETIIRAYTLFCVLFHCTSCFIYFVLPSKYYFLFILLV